MEQIDYLKLVNLTNPVDDRQLNLVYTVNDKIKDGQINKEVYEKIMEMKEDSKQFGYLVESGYRSCEAQACKFICSISKKIIEQHIKESKYMGITKKFLYFFLRNFIDKIPQKYLVAWYQEIVSKESDPNKIFEYSFEFMKIKLSEIVNKDIKDMHLNLITLYDMGVQIPTFSEHHTGLAFDLNLPGDKGLGYSNSIDETKWIFEHCKDYGFILRYPENKKVFTQIKPEPWHLRFVGSKKIASEIMDNNITFEEYHIAQYIINNGITISKFLSNSDNINSFDNLGKYVGIESAIEIRKNPKLLKDMERYMFKKCYDMDLTDDKIKELDTDSIITICRNILHISDNNKKALLLEIIIGNKVFDNFDSNVLVDSATLFFEDWRMDIMNKEKINDKNYK